MIRQKKYITKTNSNVAEITCTLFVEYNCARSIKIWWMEMYRFTWLVVSSSLNQISHFLVICIIYCSRDLDRSCSATKKKNKVSLDQLTLIFYFLCVIHLHSQFFHWWKLVELFPPKNFNWGGCIFICEDTIVSYSFINHFFVLTKLI